ncbi:SOS response-associated peptidase family protein [Flagellimonas sp. 389]|uniref:SOS response-associated peptidase family protein n=1 Tax=Flagellimonas sp. 389 TaxID=2835862 RepID=UPI001BD500D2|nr:SOS response-associated peptidase family protein [Flagellimonas sp. 389]MBS9464296.1 SOS response-associated peptidase family protein [Flagellimonas sp. 389]
MVYKLSNAAEKSIIEEKFESFFKYPNLYQPQLVIDGLVESTVSICTMENPDVIDYAIWGLMPNRYKESWQIFQNAGNTLNFDLEDLKGPIWTENLLQQARGLTIATGYFCYFLRNGEIYPYYVCLKNEEPFYLASIYTQLEDGFLSTGIITTKMDDYLASFHNLDKVQPLIIPESIAREWLDSSTTLKTIENIIKNPPRLELKANPIAGEFFKNNILYDTILQPVHYDDLSRGMER